MAARVQKLEAVDTLLYSDTVEWCKDGRFGGVLACGTYQLNEETSTRNGGARLYRLTEDNKGLQFITSTDDTGILDMRWTSDSKLDQPILFTANSDNCIKVNLVDLTSSNTKIERLQAIPLSNEDQSICLSIDLFNNESIVASDSQGRITLIDSREMNVVRQWKGHCYESWVATFAQSNEIILSGGDDCKLCLWDTRQKDPLSHSKCKIYDMGVCSIQSHPSRSHIFASGSYNETATLWDQRNLHTPLSEIPSIGGGVWRLKWHPCLPNVMGLASMHAGFHVINWEETKVIADYSGPISLGYGIDWFPCTESMGMGMWLIASCSFYDHSLYLWTCQI